MGDELRIVGVIRGAAIFMTPLVFVTERQAVALVGAPATTGAVLVGSADPAAVAGRLRAQGMTVKTTRQLHDAAPGLATRVIGGPLRFKVGVAFVAGTHRRAGGALLVTEQRRDLGVLKALGATERGAPYQSHATAVLLVGDLWLTGCPRSRLLLERRPGVRLTACPARTVQIC